MKVTIPTNDTVVNKITVDETGTTIIRRFVVNTESTEPTEQELSPIVVSIDCVVYVEEDHIRIEC